MVKLPRLGTMMSGGLLASAQGGEAIAMVNHLALVCAAAAIVTAAFQVLRLIRDWDSTKRSMAARASWLEARARVLDANALMLESLAATSARSGTLSPDKVLDAYVRLQAMLSDEPPVVETGAPEDAPGAAKPEKVRWQRLGRLSKGR